jgi:hypothetical protein
LPQAGEGREGLLDDNDLFLSYPDLDRAIEMGCIKEVKKLDIIVGIYLDYKHWYYLGEPLVNDYEFDKYEDMLRRNYSPDHPMFQVVGRLYPKCKCCK